MAIRYGVREDDEELDEATQSAGRSWVDVDRDKYEKIEPSPVRGRRVSPALDPIARMRVSAIAKWVLLAGIMLFIVWLPAYCWLHTDKEIWRKATALTTAILSSIVATGVPRTFLPQLFGKWHEAVEACRDWLVVGLTTGVLYIAGVALIGAMVHDKNSPVYGPQTMDDWLRYRLPLVVVCAVIGLMLARFLSLRGENLMDGRNSGNALMQTLIQAALISALFMPFQKGLNYLMMPLDAETVQQAHDKVVLLQSVMGYSALLCAGIAFAILAWGYSADSKLMSLQKGIVSGDGPVELTLTVVGGRNAGKTVLLAAAYHEWTTRRLGNLRINAAPSRGGDMDDLGTDLAKVANDLYVNREFPTGSVVCKDLPFDLALGTEKVARFKFLDYPGGALVGRAQNAQQVQEFYDRVDETDGVLFVADMSYVRTGRKDDEWLEVRTAFKNVLQRLIDRNGRNRVVPVALVLTKCDEFVDLDTGGLKRRELEEGLKFFHYLDLEDEWRRMCEQSGPGFAEFTIWFTSAITNSEPQTGPDGNYDMTKSYLPQMPPIPIEPSGCAAPLLWLSAKVMRWNVTMFRDLSSFIFGASPKVRSRINAMLELEATADKYAARPGK